MVRDLTVHEAMPGHYLQLAHSNEFKAPTLVRAIFQSGTFIEGWAVYTEQLMAEAGYGGPEVKMQQLKMRLRVICNAILDQSIHTANMSEQEALDLMMKEGFPAGRRSRRKMETRPAQFDSTFDLLYRSDRTSRVARAGENESRGLVRSQEIQRQCPLVRKSAREIRSRADGIVSGSLFIPSAVEGPRCTLSSVILRRAKRAEGPLQGNCRLHSREGANCNCEIPRRLRGSE